MVALYMLYTLGYLLNLFRYFFYLKHKWSKRTNGRKGGERLREGDQEGGGDKRGREVEVRE